MDIKPIETIYNGYRFRSRLEARWAVFFDALGIEYQYEPEGYEGWTGEWYLPDFYFPKYEVFAEVKGTLEALDNDIEKIDSCVDYQSTPISKGLIILGQIPNYEMIAWGNVPMFPMFYWSEGTYLDYAMFIDNTFHKIAIGEEEILMHMFGYGAKKSAFDVCYGPDDSELKRRANRKVFGDNLPFGNESIMCKWTHGDLLSNKHDQLKEAYKKARQARFEHGEKPVI